MTTPEQRWGESRAGGNTLLAQLGFADKDRANPRHDLAVAFACEIAEELAEKLTPNGSVVWRRRYTDHSGGEQGGPQVQAETCIRRPDLRNPNRPSSLLVGFADGVMRWTHSPLQQAEYDAEQERLRRLLCRDGTCGTDETNQQYVKLDRASPRVEVALIEVKITRCQGSDLVRQIEAYRGGITADGYGLSSASAILLCDFDVYGDEVNLFAQHKIVPARLGPRFEAFVREHNTKVVLPTL